LLLNRSINHWPLSQNLTFSEIFDSIIIQIRSTCLGSNFWRLIGPWSLVSWSTAIRTNYFDLTATDLLTFRSNLGLKNDAMRTVTSAANFWRLVGWLAPEVWSVDPLLSEQILLIWGQPINWLSGQTLDIIMIQWVPGYPLFLCGMWITQLTSLTQKSYNNTLHSCFIWS